MACGRNVEISLNDSSEGEQTEGATAVNDTVTGEGGVAAGRGGVAAGRGTIETGKDRVVAEAEREGSQRT